MKFSLCFVVTRKNKIETFSGENWGKNNLKNFKLQFFK